MPWLYVPDLECSKKVSDSASDGLPATAGSPLTPRFDLYVMSSGKSRRQPASWRGWKRREPIIRHLSGTTLDPSTVTRGATAFIASLQVIPVSLSARQDCDAGSATNGISGRTLPASSQRSSLSKSYSKMSPGTCPWAFRRSRPAYRTWAIGLRRDCSARLKQARATRENDSLCWLDSMAGGCSWATPTVGTNNGYGQVNPKRPGRLPDQVVNWPTPAARDWRPPNSSESQKRRGRNKVIGQQLPNHVAHYWPTPQTHDIGIGNPDRVRAGRGGGGCRNLTDEASAWNWPTPTTLTGGAEGQTAKAKRGSGGANLKASIADWPTPRACSGEGSSGAPRTAYYQAWNKGLHPMPAQGCPCHSLLLDLLNMRPGSRSSNRPGILNPRFVEMLMGWPIGSTNFTASAKEWSRFRSLTLTALSTLPLLRSSSAMPTNLEIERAL